MFIFAQAYWKRIKITYANAQSIRPYFKRKRCFSRPHYCQSIKKFSYPYFLRQSTPEEIILAILADLEGQDAEKIIIKILNKIRKFSPARASICAVQMQVFSNLRNLQDTVIKILEKIPLAIDLSKDPFFSKAFARAEAQGLAQGLSQGLSQGVAQGKAEGKAEMIAALLQTNTFSLEAIANLANEPLEFVLEVQKQFNANKKGKKANKK